METKIYAIQLDGETDVDLFSDEQFIYEAEKNNLVWSLNEFSEQFNAGCIDLDWYIRIITK